MSDVVAYGRTHFVAAASKRVDEVPSDEAIRSGDCDDHELNISAELGPRRRDGAGRATHRTRSPQAYRKPTAR